MKSEGVITNIEGTPLPTGASRLDRARQLGALLRKRLVILDGAMGTMIQRYKLTEEDFRGERFRHWPKPLKGDNDLLSITKPSVIHEKSFVYLMYYRWFSDR